MNEPRRRQPPGEVFGVHCELSEVQPGQVGGLVGHDFDTSAQPFPQPVDVGGSKSHALVANEKGRAMGFAEGGPGNYEVVGWDGLCATLQSVTQKALAVAGVRRDQIGGAGFGVAGYDWPAERAPTIKVIETLGLSAPYELVNDATIGLLAGATRGWGVVVSAGTGTNCRGLDPQGRRGIMTAKN